jgi:hypothetical protein
MSDPNRKPEKGLDPNSLWDRSASCWQTPSPFPKGAVSPVANNPSAYFPITEEELRKDPLISLFQTPITAEDLRTLTGPYYPWQGLR